MQHKLYEHLLSYPAGLEEETSSPVITSREWWEVTRRTFWHIEQEVQYCETRGMIQSLYFVSMSNWLGEGRGYMLHGTAWMHGS